MPYDGTDERILKVVESGCDSVCVLADETRLEKAVIIPRIQNLIREGFICQTEKQRCTVCSKGCQGCGIADSPGAGVTLHITEKGRKLLEQLLRM